MVRYHAKQKQAPEGSTSDGNSAQDAPPVGPPPCHGLALLELLPQEDEEFFLFALELEPSKRGGMVPLLLICIVLHFIKFTFIHFLFLIGWLIRFIPNGSKRFYFDDCRPKQTYLHKLSYHRLPAPSPHTSILFHGTQGFGCSFRLPMASLVLLEEQVEATSQNTDPPSVLNLVGNIDPKSTISHCISA